ncbi:NifU N-terminal domain-containing protein [Flavobacteriaceae bacterium]|jgi:NFU1 iron-sulfur cluster scaffold homolog, mitochondrial|nr:NifU N-terminal domain-containing protein [Flavobacteriaceae bacterium]MDA9330114.1 NifU N-terminal domain-containing protein [bacterium]MDB0042472.1 NifU N-terminal domain-containing protein [Flavobacteriaceae bacterium]MDB4148256.1 NifU N-terminal domain-containing protein [Flavobacteriaceae bacterium]MDB9994945.1 NifU N-terminal domain-containing protein [Flavobacteriaceae bacterium]|tara:strand:+ start:1153 stop:2034 length:882 start_codon:yes stop_codon:yes gene_type:complete
MEKHIIKFKETSREEELEFYSNIFLSEKRIEFEKIEETNEFPLIQQIFYLPFIKKVILNKHSVYIEKLNILKWEDVQEELCSQLEEFLNKGGLVSKNEIKKVSPVTVYAESTPNPNAMKFVVNKKIVDDVYEFKSIDETKDSPLAKSLFGFEFIKEVFFDFNFVSLIQKQGNNWDKNVMDVREFIRSFIQDNNTIVFEDRIKSQIKTKSNVEFDDISKEIIKIIDENIKPAVASDGGNIMFESYDATTQKVNVILQGACSGCPSSTITLKSGIENMLKDMLPGKISEVNAVNG